MISSDIDERRKWPFCIWWNSQPRTLFQVTFLRVKVNVRYFCMFSSHVVESSSHMLPFTENSSRPKTLISTYFDMTSIKCLIVHIILIMSWRQDNWNGRWSNGNTSKKLLYNSYNTSYLSHPEDIISPDQWNIVPDQNLESPDRFLLA